MLFPHVWPCKVTTGLNHFFSRGLPIWDEQLVNRAFLSWVARRMEGGLSGCGWRLVAVKPTILALPGCANGFGKRSVVGREQVVAVASISE